MNKKKLKTRQLSSKNKKIKRKEKEDSEGIRKKRKGDKPEMNLRTYYIIKICLIIGILIAFFQFSILLLPLFIGYTSLYYFSSWAERKINRSYNKENQKKILKVDAALAFITIVVSVASAIYSFGTMVGNRFNSLSSYFSRIMSLSTGVRKSGSGSMGLGERPDGFQKPEGGGGTGMPSGQRPPKPDFDVNDLPIEFVFNQILSSIIQILIFSVIIIGSLTIIYYFYKTYISKKRLKIKENEKNEWTFSKEELMKLLEEQI